MNKRLQKTIVVLGDNECGKTSLLKKFIKRKYEDKYKETIGKKLFT
jgi:GTPase SAR1 family protein